MISFQASVSTMHCLRVWVGFGESGIIQLTQTQIIWGTDFVTDRKYFHSISRSHLDRRTQSLVGLFDQPPLPSPTLHTQTYRMNGTANKRTISQVIVPLRRDWFMINVQPEFSTSSRVALCIKIIISGTIRTLMAITEMMMKTIRIILTSSGASLLFRKRWHLETGPICTGKLNFHANRSHRLSVSYTRVSDFAQLNPSRFVLHIHVGMCVGPILNLCQIKISDPMTYLPLFVPMTSRTG